MSAGRDRSAAARWADEAIGGAGEDAVPVAGEHGDDDGDPRRVDVADAAVEAAAADVRRSQGRAGTGPGAPDASADADADARADAGAGADAGAHGGHDGVRILSDVAALSAERDEYLGALQRLKADFDNYRKRVARLQDEQASRAAGELVRALLPVLDNLDLAVAHLGVSSEEARALDQARRQLLEVLAKEGLERLDAAGVAFDPTVHDAVAHVQAEPSVPDDGGPLEDGETNGAAPSTREVAVEGEDAGGGVAVDEVMRAGYRWRGQVLRPAMVRVRG